MAQFRLRLVTPNNDDLFSVFSTDTESFLTSTITDYKDQRKEYENNKEKEKVSEEDYKTDVLKISHVTSFSYDEKLSLHKNSQKELTFKMDDKVFIDNDWVENPFPRILKNGTQIELIDQYNNCMLFSVQKKTYTFNNANLTYNFTCQDSFTYQLTRQNNGYNLTNDETNQDFIGALDIDQWSERIVHDCYITYKYITLDTGIYLDTDGVLHTFSAPGDDIEYEPNIILNGLDDIKVNKIIKPIYNKKDYAEFYETIPYSASGSNAAASLIALGEQLGLQLNVIEGYQEKPLRDGDPVKYSRFFYFGPSKNADVAGISYTPIRDIQNFSLDFSGDSLTTVLNVKSTTWEDEEIGIFPEIPSFFMSAILTKNNWENSKYYNGFFLDLVKGPTYSDSNLIDVEPEDYHPDGKTLWKINSNIISSWSPLYNRISFSWSENLYTQFNVTTSSQVLITVSPYDHKMGIATKDIVNNKMKYYYEYEDIPEDVIKDYLNEEDDLEYYFFIEGEYNSIASIEGHTFIRLTRAWTTEEEAFANLAESCPWLENKLINIDYFYQHNIISGAEYKNIMNLLFNDLRIINGQLMCYATSYYQALHKQVVVLAELQSTLDSLSASFQADIVEPFLENGIAKSNTTDFDSKYNAIFGKFKESGNKTQLLGLNTTISDLFNKYFTAEQRFFKNIYDFRKYFEAKNIFSFNNEKILQDVTYVLSNDNPEVFIGFKNAINWNKLIADSPIILSYSIGEDTFKYTNIPLYRNNNNKFFLQKVPNPQNYKEFYVSRIKAGQLTSVESGHIYNPRNSYLWLLNDNDNFFLTFGEEVNPNDVVTINGFNYVKLRESHIRKLYLSQHTNSYYLRDTKTKTKFNYIRTTPADFSELGDQSFMLWAGLDKMADLGLSDSFWGVKSSEVWHDFWPAYKAMMPLSQVYIEDNDIQYTINEDENSKAFKYDWMICDENGRPYKKNGTNWYQYNNVTKEYDIEVPPEQRYKAYYSVPMLSYEGNLSAFFSAENDTGIGILQTQLIQQLMANKVAQANYYTKRAFYDWRKAATCSSIVNPNIGLIVNNNVKSYYLGWKNGDRPEFSLNESEKNETWEKKNSNYDLEQPVKTKGDSYYVNYVKAIDSESLINELTESLSAAQSDLNITGSKHYVNYYSHIIATYSQHSPEIEENDAKTYYVNNRYARVCTPNTIINPDDEYIWLQIAYKSQDQEVVQYISEYGLNNKLGTKFSALTYYPLVEGKSPLQATSIYSVEEMRDNDISLSDLVTRISALGTDIHFIQNTNIIQVAYTRLQSEATSYTNYIVLHLEPYETQIINNDNYKTIESSESVYNISTDKKLNLLNVTLPTSEYLFYIPEKDAQLVQVADLENPEDYLVDDSTHWYERNDLNSHTYTVAQIINNNKLNYYYNDNSSIDMIEYLETINSNAEENFNLFIHHYTVDTDHCIILDENTKSVVLNYNSSQNEYTVDGYNITITRTIRSSYDIQNMSNGDYWYFFHNRIDIPTLLQNVAVIESQLTLYWTQAYTASLYCQWFLPPSWTTETNKTNNHFTSFLYSINNSHVKLTNQILPDVQIYSYNKETVLPNYIYYYHSGANMTPSLGEYNIDEIDHLSNNPAVKTAINYILNDEIDWRNNPQLFTVKEYGKRTYYYSQGGGLIHRDVPKTLGLTEHVYPYYDGLYPMQLRVMIAQYVHAPATLYEEKLEEKLDFWRRLYARFPGIFLENTYENKNARSSEQLLQMAQLAFKDYIEPEKQYNITILNASELEGYVGQELHIGDGIQVKSSDYYSGIDDTLRALNQYLFISDISYSLRQDTNIALTVNTIKYQDKLLQSLVKLIR